MPPPYPSSCGKPRPGDFPSLAGKKPASCLSAVASTPTKKIARPASLPNLAALHAAARPRPPSSASRVFAPSSTPAEKMARPASHSRLSLMTPPSAAAARPPHQPSTPNKNAAAPPAAGKKPPASEFMAPRDAKTVHPARRLAPGTAVCVRTRFMMITDKCCLVIWLPARVVSASDAYHCTVKYSADLSPAFAGKMARKPVDHIRVLAPQRAAVKAEPRNMAPVAVR
ncbi:hypothetical protein EJB05_03622, partial [Eragrostis curvula]